MSRKDEKKRLERLRERGWSDERLTYPDLLLLLRRDPETRRLIRAIVAEDADPDEADEAPVAPLSPALSPVTGGEGAKSLPCRAEDPLRAQLASALDLLALVRADAEAASLLLPADPGSESEGRQLLRLTASAAQWDRLLSLWELLAERCKTGQRPATASERRMLDAGLDIHNLVWRDCQAALQPAEVGSRYDYKRHDRGAQDGKGDTLSAEWLPGLLNAAGKLQKKPLVAT